MSEDNKKYFFDIIKPEEKLTFLQKSASENLTAEIWLKGQDKEQVEQFEITAFDESEFILTMKQQASGFFGKFTSSKNKDKNVLIKLSFESIFLFSNTFLNYNKEDDTYSVKLDNPIYKSQQRSNYRLLANEYIKIQFKVDNEVFTALDISAGGTCFQITEDLDGRFKKDDEYKGCVIRLSNQNFEIPNVKIAGQWPHSWTDDKGNVVKGFKVGVSFIDVPKNVESDLYITINAEARGEELRRIQAEKRKVKV